jgi:hypothetical protein
VSLSPATLPNGTLNTAYLITFVAAGGKPPYRWSVASGNLPPGLSLSTAGTISGKPTKTRTYAVTVKVTDSSNPVLDTTAAYSLTIG